MLRAVVIDDEIYAAENLVRMLEDTGMAEVEGWFVNPVDALDKLGSLNADVIFTDVVMPGMDGMTLANRVQQMDRPVRVVFVSGHDKYAVDAFEAGALDYLLKPVTQERLRKTLRNLKKHPLRPI